MNLLGTRFAALYIGYCFTAVSKPRDKASNAAVDKNYELLLANYQQCNRTLYGIFS